MKEHSFDTATITTIGMFTAILAVLSILQIPMPSGVPITLQTFAVALCGYVLGRKNGTLCVLLYLLLGRSSCLHRYDCRHRKTGGLHWRFPLWFPVPGIFLWSWASSEKQSRFLRSWCLGLTDLPCTGCLPLLYHCSDHFSGSLPAGICTVSGKRYTVRTGCYAGCRCHPQNTGQRRN